MNRSLLFFVLLFIVSTGLFAQSKTWVGLNIGLSSDHYDLTSPDNSFVNETPLSPKIGIQIEHRLNDLLYLGWGLKLKPYSFKKTLSSNRIEFGSGVLINTGQVPVYLKFEKQIGAGLAGFHFFAGGNFAFNFDYYPDDYSNNWQAPFMFPGFTFPIDYETKYDSDLRRTFFLLRAGGGIHFPIMKDGKLSFSVSRAEGFVPIIENQIRLIEDSQPQPASTYTSKGSYTAFNIQFLYDFEKLKFWKK